MIRKLRWARGVLERDVAVGFAERMIQKKDGVGDHRDRAESAKLFARRSRVCDLIPATNPATFSAAFMARCDRISQLFCNLAVIAQP